MTFCVVIRENHIQDSEKVQNPGIILMSDYLSTQTTLVFLVYVFRVGFSSLRIILVNRITIRSLKEHNEKVTYKKDETNLGQFCWGA